jgi:hypothetical protein
MRVKQLRSSGDTYFLVQLLSYLQQLAIDPQIINNAYVELERHRFKSCPHSKTESALFL